MKPFYPLFVGVMLLFTPVCLGQSISLSLPIDHSVVQRNNSGSTNVWVAGQFLSPPIVFSNAQYQVLSLDTKTGNVTGTAQAWTSFIADAYGLFRFSVSLPAGWYQLNLQVTANNTSQTASVKVGVGDVFYIAWQSNGQGVTSSSIPNVTAYDGVVADQSYEHCSMQMPRYPYMQSIQSTYGIGTQGPNSWCYTALGNWLVDNAGNVPVAFFNGAQAGTYIQNWVDAANNQPTYYWFADTRNVCATDPSQNSYYVGQPYRSFKNLLQYQGGLFGARGVIWHQGESDSQQGTTTTNYTNRFNTLAQRFRAEIGNYNMPCWIAKATFDRSRNGTTDAAQNFHSTPYWQPVQNAQDALGSSSPTRTGVNSDGIAVEETNSSSPYYRPDGVHFTGNQLLTLGTGWASAISNGLTATTPTLAQMPPPIQLTYNGFNQYTASVVNYSGQYFWTSAYTNAIRLDPNQPTGSSQSMSSSNGPYRCYVKTSQGVFAVSQVIRAPSSPPSYRMAAEGSLDLEPAANPLRLTVSPNPAGSQTRISFTVANRSAVRLELLDQTGRVVRTIVDQMHSEGTYQYPVDLTTLPASLLFCRLKADDVFTSRKIIRN